MSPRSRATPKGIRPKAARERRNRPFMRKPAPAIPILPPAWGPARPVRPAQKGIPPTKIRRDSLMAAVRQYVRATAPTPPLGLAELRMHCDRVIESTGADEQWRDWLAVLLSNEVWRDQLAGIPFSRRLLLLPQCLRNADACRGAIDSVGLLCGSCGSCVIQGLQAEAQRLGYVVLVAEGSPAVVSLLESGQVQAVVGVSCLEVLERVFPYMQAAAVPGLAVPLVCDGCKDTALDLDWLWEAMHLTSDDVTRRLDLDELRKQVEGWFEPASLDETLGPAEGRTGEIARDWLARSGKRWRPFLTACAYQALRQDVEAPLPEDLRKLSVAVECFHKASLIHDDIEDADPSRYDRQTLHTEHGVPVALNVGDLLLGEGYRLIAECRCPSGRKVEMLRAAAEGHRTLCLGQGAELCWSRDPSPLSAAEVLDVFRRKTAPAFEVALHLGATLAGAGENVHEVLSRYSEALGIAYQIRDDLDDFHAGQTAQADRKGDAHEDRPNILLAVASENAQGDDRRRLDDVWRRRSTFRQHWAELEGLFERTGVVARTGDLMESYKQLAAGCLGRLDNPSLKGLLRRVITRIFNDTQTLFCCDDNKQGNARLGRQGGQTPG